MESNHRFYMRRAAEERSAARRAITVQAREWHAKLALEFAERALASDALSGQAMANSMMSEAVAVTA